MSVARSPLRGLSFVALMLTLAGCRGIMGDYVQPTAPPLSATGVVITAEGPNAAEVDTFSLRTAGGELLSFVVGRLNLSDGGLPAPHLREHLTSGEPITVWYYLENGNNVALRYTDASE